MNFKLRITLFILVLTIFLSTTVLNYMGAFNSINIEETRQGPYYFIYKKNSGSYSKVYEIGKEIKTYAQSMKVENPTLTGVYYDVPNKVETEKLRSEIGFIVSKETFERIQTENTNSTTNFKIIQPRKYVSTSFPNKNILSPLLGIYKVYPAIDKFMVQKGQPAYEYKTEGYETHYALEVYYPKETIYAVTLGE